MPYVRNSKWRSTICLINSLFLVSGNSLERLQSKTLLALFSIPFVVLAIVPGAVVAQEFNADGDGVVEEILVSGTRIKRDGASAPIPTTVVGLEAIQLSGAENVADIINVLPALTPGLDRQSSGFGQFGNAGLNCANLRNLGVHRTLTLVNGRRHAPTIDQTEIPCVDINNIPTTLVERIEITTGGASAVYGADAVAGVINFVMKDNFEGVEFQGQAGISAEGDANRESLSLTMGMNSEDGKGNSWIHLSLANEDGLRFPDRDFAVDGLTFVTNPAAATDPDAPAQIAMSGLGQLGFFAAVPNVSLPLQIDPNSGELTRSSVVNNFAFNPDGTLRAFDLGGLTAPIDGFLANRSGGDAGSLFDRFDLTVPTERVLFAAGAHYDLAPNIRLKIDGKYSKSESSAELGAFFEIPFVNSFINVAENPFVSDEIQDLLLGAPGFADVPVIGVSRVDEEFGPRGTDAERKFWQVGLGISGDLGEKWSYELAYQYAESSASFIFTNDRLDARFAQAMDAITDPVSGETVCRDPSNGCVPINVFGPIGSISQGAIDFIRIQPGKQSNFEQQVITGFVSGDVFQLPYGPAKLVAGFEYRKDKLDTDATREFNEGLGFFGSVLSDVKGDIDVTEFFGEILIPLVNGVRGIESLNLEAAIRFSDYNLAGNNTSWKVGLDYAPVSDIRFRSVFSTSVRAPNAGEIFSAGSLGAVQVFDPCDELAVNAGSASRSANCAALGITQPFVSDTRIVTTLQQTEGNPDLDVEEADTLTLGIVLAPRWLENFQVSVDYWDIELSGGISSFDAQSILNNCVDFASLDNEFCPLIDRVANGNIALISNSLINVSSIDTSGIDIEASYYYDWENVGTFRFNLLATNLDKRDFILAPGTNANSDVDPSAGEHGLPKWKWNFSTTYSRDAFTLFAKVRYIGETVRNLLEENPSSQRSPFKASSRVYTDIQGRWEFRENMTAFLGASNLFDTKPPKNPDVRTGTPLASNGLPYDLIGQYFYFGININL